MLLARVIVFFLVSETYVRGAEDCAPCETLLNFWKRRSSTLHFLWCPSHGPDIPHPSSIKEAK